MVFVVTVEIHSQNPAARIFIFKDPLWSVTEWITADTLRTWGDKGHSVIEGLIGFIGKNFPPKPTVQNTRAVQAHQNTQPWTFRLMIDVKKRIYPGFQVEGRLITNPVTGRRKCRR